MKRVLLMSVLMGALPLTALAQDDLYFTPTETTDYDNRAFEEADDKPAYYRGSNRSVDEYNRYGKFRSHYQKIGTDSIGNDIITFVAGQGLSPDSSYVDTLFYGPASSFRGHDEDFYERPWTVSDDDYWGWRNYWRDRWTYGGWYGLYDPWYASTYWGWADPWYSPWGWYGGWWYGAYDPYYSWYGWGYPYDYWYDWGYPYHGGGWAYNNGGGNFRFGTTGTRNHGGWASRGASRYSDGRSHSGNFSGYRGGGSGSRSMAGATRSYGRTAFGGGSSRGTVSAGGSRSGNFSGLRVNSRSNGYGSGRSSSGSGYSRSYSGGGSSYSGGSSFSGGGSRGGGFSGGGGSHGGGGSRGGGVSMGGRR